MSFLFDFLGRCFLSRSTSSPSSNRKFQCCASRAHPLFRFLSFFSLPVDNKKQSVLTDLQKRSSGSGGRGRRGGAAALGAHQRGGEAGENAALRILSAVMLSVEMLSFFFLCVEEFAKVNLEYRTRERGVRGGPS